MRRVRLATATNGAVWFLGGLLTACATAGLLCLASLAALETHVSGMSGRIGFSGDWVRRFPVGARLAVAWDRAMPRGYERIYLHQGGEIIGSLPESPLASRVREAVAGGQAVQVKIVELDRFDPARGLRVRVSFASDRRQSVQPVAVQALNGPPSLM